MRLFILNQVMILESLYYPVTAVEHPRYIIPQLRVEDTQITNVLDEVDAMRRAFDKKMDERTKRAFRTSDEDEYN